MATPQQVLNEPATIKQVAEFAGFSGTHKGEAMGIAWAESRLDAHVTSPNPDGGTNIGIMQIDYPAHKPEADKYGMTEQDLQNAWKNMQLAYVISKGGSDWSAWATYKSGAYKHFYGRDGQIKGTTLADTPPKVMGSGFGPATPAIQGGIDAVNSVVNSVPEALREVAKALAAIAKIIGEVVTALFSTAFWVGAGKVIIGLVLTYYGLKRIISVS